MKWEHMTIAFKPTGLLGGKVDTEELTTRLDEAGAAGWELVNIFATTRGHGRTRVVVAVLKRGK